MGALAAGLGALLVAMVTLRVGDGDIRVPFSYTWDGTAMLLVAKGIAVHGSYLSIPELGAPGGQQLYDFPFETGSLNLFMLRLMSAFSSDPALLLNLFYLTTFPLVSLAAYTVLRGLHCSVAASVVVAVLYTSLPYHFLQLDHAFLAAYYPAPVGASLVLAILGGRPLFERRSDRGSWVSGRSMLTLASVAVIGCGGLYYAGFTVFLVAGATLAAQVFPHRRRATLVSGAGITAGLLAVILLNHAPSLVHTLTHGRNPEAGIRYPQESEWYSLGIAQLVLPMPQHRVAPLARLGLKYDTTGLVTAPKGTVIHMGAIASAGFLGLLALALVAALGGSWGRPRGLARSAATACVLAFLIGTTGGLGAVFAYLVTPQLRAWDRITVFIAFFSLAAVALALDRVRDRLRDRRFGAGLFAATLLGVVGLGLADQTSRSFVPYYTGTAAAYRNDAAFVASIEARLPAGAMILELPLQQFPEVTRYARMTDYDLLHPWIHSRQLRWSYGGVRGRDPWTDLQMGRPVPELLRNAASAGFLGVYLDRFGYAEGSNGVEAELERELGVSPVVSGDGRLLLYDMRPFRKRLGIDPAGV